MKISPVIELKNKLLMDEDYKRYKRIYIRERTINRYLLTKLLDRYLDLYYFFIKSNIFIYRYDIKDLNDELKDYLHHKGKLCYIDDLEDIFRHYYNQYDRCQATIKSIIEYKLRPLSEIELLTKIILRPLENEIKWLYDEENNISYIDK